MIITLKALENFSKKDIEEFAVVMKKVGFEVVSITSDEPKKPKASKPVAYTPKSEATDVELPVDVVGDGFMLGFGSGRAGAKLYIKSLGFKWDANKMCYRGADLEALKLKGKAGSKRLTVPAKWVQAGRDKAIAKASK